MMGASFIEFSRFYFDSVCFEDFFKKYFWIFIEFKHHTILLRYKITLNFRLFFSLHFTNFHLTIAQYFSRSSPILLHFFTPFPTNFNALPFSRRNLTIKKIANEVKSHRYEDVKCKESNALWPTKLFENRVDPVVGLKVDEINPQEVHWHGT